jgi:hypothetical protein
MATRGHKSSGTARLLVLVGILTVLGVTFVAGVYAGRIWAARSLVVTTRALEPEGVRRGSGRGVRAPETPGPQLTFYQELTAPLTAPPPPPKPAKTSPPPLVAVAPPAAAAAPPAALVPPPAPVTVPPPALAAPAPAVAQRPGEQADTLAAMVTAGAPTSVARDAAAPALNRPPTDQAGLAAPATTGGVRYTVQVAAYRVRPPADALRDALAAAGHDARVVEADAKGVVYRVQVGEFATREAARTGAARLTGERSTVTPFVTTR